MRILLVSDHYPPFIGGVQRQTRTMALGFAERGHDVGVVTVWQDTLPAREDTDGYPVWRIRQLRTAPGLRGEPRRRHQAPGPDPITAWQLRRIIRRFKPDVVHSSGWLTHSAALAMLGTSLPLIVSAREYGFICANASLLHFGEPCSGPAPAKCLACSRSYFGGRRGYLAVVAVWLSRPLLRWRTTALHSVSTYVNDLVAPAVLGRHRAERTEAVIPSFRTESDDRPDPDVLARLPREPFILFVGALRRVKGVETLFAAYERLEPRRRPPLVLLGTPEVDTPSRLPEGAVLLGGASYATVLAVWDRCMFGVMPSLWPEPFGSVVHEGMSRGKPVIGTRPGGHTDMIESGRTGLLVDAGDVAALTRAMRRLIDDPHARDRIGRAAALRARRFRADRVLPRFEELYEELLADPEDAAR